MNMKVLILDRTLGLLSQTNYSDISMKSIARACGISEPAIYYHFKSKNKLFRELVFSVLEEARQLVISAASRNESLRDTLVFIARYYLQDLESSPIFPRAYLALATDPSLKTVIENLQDEIEYIQILFMDIFSRELLDGTIREDADLDVACRMFRGSVLAVMMSSVYARTTLIPSPEAIVDLLLNGLLK